MLLSVNISESNLFSITSLAWYHNGTEITSGSGEQGKQVIIGNTGTRLSITNMEESDSGTYQVKITSTSLDSAACDALTLPLFESTAGHAPVTFTVQEQHTPTYNPSSSVSVQYITGNTMELQSDTTMSSLRVNRHGKYWYRNGRGIVDNGVAFNSSGSSLERLSLQVTSDIIRSDITGDYLGIVWIYYSDLEQEFRDMCNDNHFSFKIPVIVSHWSIRAFCEFIIIADHYKHSQLAS